MSTPSVWPNLTYTHANAAIDFLTEAFGFEQLEVHHDPDDDSLVVHAELRWTDGSGGVMLASVGTGGSGYESRLPGNDSIYVVCSDPDALFARVSAAGATVVRPLTDADYGSRGFVVKDPEGNLWAFGTYGGS